ncbi:ShlB/FhaC/HecB family hemolysin secretion/activation protein [Spartinivicinus ruber]|uniref:ShlB/FhaC/HecB family hemolysin secretion/activation protein n=1 Tax=Spartinivicinus ruber TaxID=2683272 RepID=UPI0013D457AE|nr:ShlB/FhaC/HecB family hemolysin secretion/activation protein [Spartinivicinus ruber]
MLSLIKTKGNKLLVLLVATNFCLYEDASAVDIPTENNQLRNPLIDEEQRLKAEEIQKKQQFTPGQELKYEPEAKQFDDIQCVKINKVKFKSVTLIAKQYQQKLVNGYEFTCLTAKKINQLLLDITRYYIESGYITSRPLKPIIDEDTNLVVPIVEGKISEVEPATGNAININTAIPNLYKDVFNIRDLEQGLDQVNRLTSNDVTVELAPGKAFGTSKLVVNNTDEKQWHLYISADNYNEGRDSGSISFSYDNLLGLNDNLFLNWRHQLWYAEQDNESKSINWSVPYGYWTFAAFISEFEYLTPIELPNQKLNATGFNREQGVRVDYVAFRDQKNKLSLAAQLIHKKIRNYLNDSLITISSHDLTLADFSINWFRIGLGALWVSEVGYSQGLGIIGGDDKDPPDTQFEKWRYSINMIKSFTNNWQLVSLLSGQFSRDILPGTEQLQIGSPYTVRGFRDQSASASKGIYWQNTLYAPWSNLIAEDLKWRPYLGLDTGRVAANGDTSGRELAGVTTGITFDWQQTGQVDIQLARSLKKPDSFDQEGWHALIRFAINW